MLRARGQKSCTREASGKPAGGEGDYTEMMTYKVRGGGVKNVSDAAQRDSKMIIMAVRNMQ